MAKTKQAYVCSGIHPQIAESPSGTDNTENVPGRMVMGATCATDLYLIMQARQLQTNGHRDKVTSSTQELSNLHATCVSVC